MKEFRYDVFISYCQYDALPAKELADRLRSEGLSVWFDRDCIEPGTTWIWEIERGIEESRHFLILIGEEGASPWWQRELNLLLASRPYERGSRIIPVLCPGGDPSKIPDHFNVYRYVDLRTWSKRIIDELVVALKETSHKSEELDGLNEQLSGTRALPTMDKEGIKMPHTISSDNERDITMISILFLAADPSDASRLRLGEEFREIQEKLKLAKLRDRFKLELPQLSVRPADISQALLDTQPQIVHFSGHGTSTGALCFENQVGQTHLVQPDALAALFEQFTHQVNCVLLNACYSENQAKAIAEHIEYVIGMNQAIGDKAAIAFAIGFYQALGAGRTIEDAYKLGCVQIRLQGIPEHLTPVLIKKGQGGSSQAKSQSGLRLISNAPSNPNTVYPQLALKIIDNMGQHLDEVTFAQTTNNQEFSFGFALVNTSKGSDPAKEIDIRIECSWDGNSITSAPKFNTDRHERTTIGWQATRQLIQQGDQPYPAVLAFHGTDERCAYGHPLEWHRFSVIVAERMIGRFILRYIVSSATPKSEYRGQLAVIITQ